MRRAITTLFVLIAVVGMLLAGLGWWSQRTPPATSGVVDGRLGACPAEPHCVCSEAGDSSDSLHSVAPLALPALTDTTRWQVIRRVLADIGGQVQSEDQGYLHATFESGLFRFVDDLELRMDGDRLQLRSSSRVGYSDLNANAKRAEALRARLAEAFVGVKP